MQTRKQIGSDPVQISIPRPCEENFAAMPIVEGGRLCGQCSQVVIDFTRMTDAQLIDWMRSHRGGCGIFRRDQLDRDLIEPVVRKAPFGMGWLLSLLIIAGCIRADNGQKLRRQPPGTEQHAKPEDGVLLGEPPLASGMDAAGAKSQAGTARRARNYGQRAERRSRPEIVGEVTGPEVMGGFPVSMHVPDPVVAPETDSSKRPSENIAAKSLPDINGLRTAGVYSPEVHGRGGGLTVSGARSSGTTIIIDGVQRKPASRNVWRRIFGRR